MLKAFHPARRIDPAGELAVMHLGVEGRKVEGEVAELGPFREVRGAEAVSLRVHFHAVHNVGEQLRCSAQVKTGKKPDRMEGR